MGAKEGWEGKRNGRKNEAVEAGARAKQAPPEGTAGLVEREETNETVILTVL